MQIFDMPTRSKALLMRCTACGVEASASCNCGAAYEPASAVAARVLSANPTKSNRAVAEIAGVAEATVRRLRSGASNDAPEKIEGRDGKSYTPSAPKPKPEVILLEPLDYTLHMFEMHVQPWLEQLDEKDAVKFWEKITKGKQL